MVVSISCPGCDSPVLFGSDDFGEAFVLDADPDPDGTFVAENLDEELFRVHECVSPLIADESVREE